MVAMGEDEEEDYGYFDEDEEGEEGEAAAPTSEPEVRHERLFVPVFFVCAHAKV